MPVLQERRDEMQLEEMEANAGRAVTLLKALANERRLFILCQLLERELSVGNSTRAGTESVGPVTTSGGVAAR